MRTREHNYLEDIADVEDLDVGDVREILSGKELERRSEPDLFTVKLLFWFRFWVTFCFKYQGSAVSTY